MRRRMLPGALIGGRAPGVSADAVIVPQGCLDYLAELFNKFAYANIAMYGNGYITAAKETWRLVRDVSLPSRIPPALR